MFLKALELTGFKSFPDKTRLDFTGGITAIVGPNGSGKSNISDALRWVMGEQSTKALRGAKMEDVIFGGTQKRGQKGYCEVTLVLDNTDGTIESMGAEIEITRRYYRSGDSEYKLNRQTVRLRDINELLMDTGLGRDGYSIIGQGRIDEILSIKSTDRREIFEAAAGITRYRYRKEEAGRKLERAGQDLLRAGDKISELELQLEPLQKQSEAAKKYLSLRDTLRGLEISIWTEDLENLSKRADELGEALKDSTLQKAKADNELEKLYAGGEELAEKSANADIEAGRIRDEISAKEAEGAQIASQIAQLNTAIEAGQENARHLEEELSFQSDREGGVTRQIAQRRESIVSNSLEIGKLQARLDSMEDGISGLGDEDARQAAKLARAAAEESINAEKLTSVRDRLTTLAATAQELEDRDTALLKQVTEADERLDAEKRSAEECQKQADEAKGRERSLENALRGYALRCDSRRKRAEKAEDAERSLKMDANNLKGRIQMLREMERDYTGFSRAVKTVMQEASAGRLRNIVGTVAENFKVPDKYTLAVEIALGGAIGDIITGTEDDAKTAIQLLKRRDGGRATFLPMTSVKGSEINERGLASEAGYEGIASQLVSFDEKLRGIYTQLLGRTIVAKDLDSAVRIARKYNYRYRIVTLDGQLTNAGGSMTGGSVSKNTGILSRANELERLEKAWSETETKLNEAAQAVAAAKKELAAAEYDMNLAQDELNRAREEAAALMAKAQQYGVLLDTLEESRTASKAELAAVRERLGECERDMTHLRGQIAQLEDTAAQLKAGLDEISRSRSELAQKVSEVSTQMAGLRTRMAALEAENEASQGTIKELEELREQMGGDRLRQQDQIRQLEDRQRAWAEELKLAEAQQEEVRKQIADLRLLAEAAAQKRLELEAERTRRDRRIQDANNRVHDLARDISELERKLDAAQSDAAHLADRLWETYELSRSAAMAQRQELPEGRDAAVRQAAVLKRQMSALGTPNIGAIDEYKRVKERYDFLAAQRDDIQKSIDELEAIIADISGNMEEIFSGEFENIKTAFAQTFSDLFGGGTAELRMEDPDNILDSGIEILVQPPGKKLKNLSLLSGGEKAYVAIALYFAILKVHAAPFVVMDEIEAALDEENVARYAAYMRTMCDKTQFLVITHRRGTMEEANMLYGVTMQEQGVSRVLTLDLEEAEKTAGK